MSVIIKKLISSYQYAMEVWADPRVLNYPLMQNPALATAIVLGYLYFVLSLGPKLMNRRKPFSLDKILIVYNIIQIVCSLYVFAQLFEFVFKKYDCRCATVDYSESPDGYKAANIIWFYFILKIIDLLDTVFFVLRKKNNQVSFLHVYHHAGMVVLTWIGTKFVAGGHSIYIPFINSFVHSVMYFYYLLSAWDKSFQTNFWWKKYITQMQLTQFFLLMLLYTSLLFRSECKYPKWVSVLLTPQYLFITILFLDFYVKSYVKKPKQESRPIKKATFSKVDNKALKNTRFVVENLQTCTNVRSN